MNPSIKDVALNAPEAHPHWDDPSLQVASDSARRARYRLLQSWYRETVLHAPPGKTTPQNMMGNERTLPVGSMLGTDERQGRRLNFLTDEIASYAQKRAEQVREEGGTLEPDRLYRNMLSSMPLCFNLFGWLREHPSEAGAALGQVFGLDIAHIKHIEVEWAPPDAKQQLGDRTAFDAYVEYFTTDGEPGFVGVETKYTEQFSQTEYSKARYRELTEAEGSGFKAGAADALVGSKTNQLWRNTLLAISLRRQRGWRLGHAAVLACAGDLGVKTAVAGLSEWHSDSTQILRAGTLEALVTNLAQFPVGCAWATEFQRRYLDTTIIDGGSNGGASKSPDGSVVC